MMAVSVISVQKEYEKLRNVKQEDIKEIMAWLGTQPHLPHQYITELDIILAYHSCACDTEVTKRVIDVNYTLRTLFPFYHNRKMDKCLENAFQTWPGGMMICTKWLAGVEYEKPRIKPISVQLVDRELMTNFELIVPLSNVTKKGYKPIYCELLDADPQKFVYADVIKAFFMVMDLWQNEEGTVPGVALIVNLDRVSLGHISKVNLTVAQQFFYFLQEAMFVCLKEFHFINAPTFIDKLLAMVRPFLKDELLDILKVHQTDVNTLDEYISTNDLLKADKGNKEALKDTICKKLAANSKFFEYESKLRVDESKRPGGPKSTSTFFPGMEDSFKKLEID